jgi:CheY-like chemotaxis protein
VRGHGGAISVESHVGVGTTFHVYFPAAAEAFAPRGHGEHVLFVDAEGRRIDEATRTLERLGYQVTVTTDADRALEDFRARPYDFDVIVADLALPGRAGTELARRLREIRPGIPIVLTAADVAAPGAGEVPAPGAVVARASLVAELGTTLRRILTGSPES